MAQMPIQLASGRVAPYAAPPPAAPPPGAPPATAGGGQAVDSGAIPGGLLRPGSIDQMTFRQRLEAANRGGPVPPRASGQSPLLVPETPRPAPSIPTLTPAQLAALGLDVSALGEIAPPPPQPAPAAAPADAAPEPATEPTTKLASAPPLELAPEAVTTAAAAPAAAADAPAPNAPIPGARLGADGVWEVPRLPDKDERAWFQGMNATWRVVENPESVKLFLGEDGRFGLDDFVDLINPLQHIPLVNIAYRALTGDEINGAAQMVSAVAFGPLATASTVIDLAFKSETGAGLADNAIAMVFGSGDAVPDDVASYATAAGNTQTADLSQIRRGSNR